MKKLLTLAVMVAFVLTASTPALAQSLDDPVDNTPLPDNGDINEPPPDPGKNPPPPDNGGGDRPPPDTGGNPPPPGKNVPRPRPGPDPFVTIVVCGQSVVVDQPDTGIVELEPSISIVEDCEPADEPLNRADLPVLADVPKEAGSSGSKSFRGFTQTLGGDGSTGIPPAAAAEIEAPAGEPEVGSDPTGSRSTGTGSSEASDEDTPESGAAGDARPENTKPRALPDTGGTPLVVLGALAALVAGGLLIRRIAR